MTTRLSPTKRSIALFFVFLLACSTMACAKTEPITYQSQLDMGARFLNDGNYEGAILAFQAAIEIDPRNADAYLSLADVYLAMGDADSAIAILTDALTVVDDAAAVQARLDELMATLEPEPEPEPGSGPEPEPEPEPKEAIEVGDYLTFGSFNSTPILWQVVGNEDGALKLFSANVLFNGQIDADVVSKTTKATMSVVHMEGGSDWSTSDLQRYLNSNESVVSYKATPPNYSALPGFLTNFSANELALIQNTTHESAVHYNSSGYDVEVEGEYYYNYTVFQESFEDSYSDIKHITITEKVFLPDMLELRELTEAGLTTVGYYYDNESGSFVSTDTTFFTRMPVYENINTLSNAYYFGMYYMYDHSRVNYGDHFDRKNAKETSGIRPMCYIRLKEGQAFTGLGTVESPCALEF